MSKFLMSSLVLIAVVLGGEFTDVTGNVWKATAKCEPGYFNCESGLCIPDVLVCDGVYNCNTGNDEANCLTKRADDLIPVCKPDEFHCGNRICIASNLVCNGKFDCESQDDERDCQGNMKVNRKCGPGYFLCDSGLCIPDKLVCDGILNCNTGNDENHCEHGVQKCVPGYFLCESGLCIPENLVCDGIFNCNTGNDEKNCDKENEGIRCRGDDFQCDNGMCIKRRLVCDGVHNCPSGIDEGNCLLMQHNYKQNIQNRKQTGYTRFLTCQPGYFLCQTGLCVANQQRCDGIIHCPLQDDETDCGINHSDQRFPINRCNPGQFRCKNGQCIKGEFRCDGIKHCPTFEDEMYCKEIKKNQAKAPHTPTIRCNPGEFLCQNGQCIKGEFRCDGINHCPTFEDERDCGENKNPAQNLYTPVQTQVQYTPIQTQTRYAPNVRCNPGEFLCQNGLCIKSEFRCDGIGHCPRFEDERDCEEYKNPIQNPYAPNIPCSPGEFLCRDGKCIKAESRCDGIYDCSAFEDEVDCAEYLKNRAQAQFTPTKTCNPGEFLCKNGQCIRGEFQCDGINHCPTFEDERDCEEYEKDPIEITCNPKEFTCQSGRCIREDFRCDGHYDCPTYDDEINCVEYKKPAQNLYTPVPTKVQHTPIKSQTRYGPMCNPGEFRCRTGLCIKGEFECDGIYHCPAHEDEANCVEYKIPTQLRYTPLQTQTQLTPSRTNARFTPSPKYTKYANIGNCEPGEFLCQNGQCIKGEFRCDGITHCPTLEDELNCGENKNPPQARYNAIPTKAKFTPSPTNTRFTPSPRYTQYTPAVTCKPGEFLCQNGQCIKGEFRCDGITHCPTLEDEINCGENKNLNQARYTPVPTKVEFTPSPTNTRFTPSPRYTKYTPTVTCNQGEFLCQNGQCIKGEFRCDGINHCPTSEDERNCGELKDTDEARHTPTPTLVKFTPSQFTPSPTNTRFTPSPQYTESTSDITCKPGEFLCQNGQCIKGEFRCDGNYDCPTYDDEINCVDTPNLTPRKLET